MEENSGKKIDKAYLLGRPVSLIDMQDSLELALNFIKRGQGGHVVTINPEIIMYSLKDQEFAEIISNSDLVLPDGVGIKIALKKLGLNIEQVPGIEFSYKLIEKCVENSYNIGFLGASKDVITIMTEKFKSKYPSINIVFSRDGYFNKGEEQQIIEELKNKKPHVLFVALGVPKQDFFIAKYREMLDSVIMIGVGGSFDVWAGKVNRAPSAFRKLGLEWFYRLITQPSRFNRMFPTLPLFFIKVFLDNKNTRKEN